MFGRRARIVAIIPIELVNFGMFGVDMIWLLLVAGIPTDIILVESLMSLG